MTIPLSLDEAGQMASWTKICVIGATLSGGIVAGLALDKALIQWPAWREMGSSSWLVFARHAELGRGRIVLPAEGIGALWTNRV